MPGIGGFRTSILHARLTRSRRLRRTDLWCPHGFGHAVENRHALAAASGRERLLGLANTTADVLPVIHHPDIAGRIDGDVGLHLQAASNIATGRSNLVAGVHAGRTSLGADPAQLHDRAVW